MQITQHDTTPAMRYRERLTPSLWTIVAAAVVAPMAALAFAPIDPTLALVAGVAVGLGLIGLLIAVAPVVELDGAHLRAGRAVIDVAHLGQPRIERGEGARNARGAGLDPRGWHLIRAGIDGVIVVPVTDPDDPVTAWTISTRTPDRLTGAIRHAQARRHTPGR